MNIVPCAHSEVKGTGRAGERIRRVKTMSSRAYSNATCKTRRAPRSGPVPTRGESGINPRVYSWWYGNRKDRNWPRASTQRALSDNVPRSIAACRRASGLPVLGAARTHLRGGRPSGKDPLFLIVLHFATLSNSAVGRSVARRANPEQVKRI